MIRLLCLLCCLGLLPALEITYDLPNPAVVNALIRGRIQLVNNDQKLVDFEVDPNDDVTVQINPNDQRQESTFINGRHNSVISFGLTARFHRQGSIPLPTVTFVNADGERFSSRPQVIQVDLPRDDLRGDIACTVRLEPSTIVPGETCTMIYEIAVNYAHGRRWNINDLNGANLPEGAVELGEQTSSEGSAYDALGNEWGIHQFRQPFTMTSPGTYRIGSQQHYVNRRGRGTTPVRPAVLTVSPLPMEGRPPDYQNLVGEVTIEARLDRTRIALGEGAQLIITVDGQRLDLLGDIELDPIPGLRAYLRDAEQDEQSSNRRVFRWDLVPEAAGSYDIPGFSLPWFNPATRSYQRSQSDPLLLNVIPGRKRDLQIVGGLQNLPGDETPVSLSGPTMPDPIGPDRRQAIRPLALVIAAIAGLLVSLLSAGVARQRRRGPRRLGAAERSRRALAVGDLAAANQALSELVARHHDQAQRQAATTLLQAVEAARFGLGGDIESLARQAKELRDP